MQRGRPTFSGMPRDHELTGVTIASEDRDALAGILRRYYAWSDAPGDPACRDRRLLSHLSTIALVQPDLPRAEDLSRRLSPRAAAWSASPSSVVTVADAALASEDAARFLQRVLDEHPDPEVRGAVLLARMRRAWRAGDDATVAATLEIVSGREYAGTRAATLARLYDPDHALAAGRKLPQFTAHDLDTDGVIDVSALDRDLNLLVLWGLYCEPCIEEMPNLHALAKEFPDLRIVSIAVHDAPEALRAFRPSRFPMPWRNGWLAGEEATALLVRFEWHHVPQYVLVDREGTIIAGPPRLDLHGVFRRLRASAPR